MSNEYVVLRREPAARGRFRGETRSPGVNPTILTARLDDAAAAKSDHSVVAAAPAMPMRLFLPVSRKAAAAGSIAWGVSAVRADVSTLSGQGVTVAILDTGIDRTHPAFAGVELVERDFTGEGDGDDDGHGTHCAGTILGRDVNETRIGVARGVERALIGKVIGSNGGSSKQVLDGILWAVENGAHVISMSLGMDFTAYQRRLKASGFPDEVATSRALDAYRENVLLFERLAGLIKAGAFLGRTSLLIAAAGNESRRDLDPRFEVACSPPAVSDGFISVAAVGQRGIHWGAAPFSNINASLAAPGVDVVSAEPGGGLVSMSGTSMAAPHVAGIATLFAEKQLRDGAFRPQLAAAQVLAAATVLGLAPGSTQASIGAGVAQAPLG